MQKLITSCRAFLVFALFLGLIYPLFIMGIGQVIFPVKANGSLLKNHDNTIIGSKLIAQEFTAHKYFHSRFSAINYNAADSGASNLSISNAKLYKQTKKHINHIRLENDFPDDMKLPADMVLESASGLDPHISLANTMLQLPRVAKHRGLTQERVKKLIETTIDDDFIGIWGAEGVNVLKLNIALDKPYPS